MATIRQSAPVRAVILIIFLLQAASLSACYTLVQHRRVASLGFQKPAGNSCTGCHTPQELRGYVKPSHLAPDPPPWDALGAPWWLPADSTGGGG